jgi:hypothetical protein
MTNKKLATEFVKKFPHMMLALASDKDSEKFFIKEIEKLLNQREICKHNWIIRNEEKDILITNKGKVFNQIRECLECGKIEKRQVIYSNVGVGLTPVFEGIYNE